MNDFLKHIELLCDERNSLLYWYPKIKNIAPTPKTCWYKVRFTLDWLENGVPDEVVNEVAKMIDKEFFPDPYPVFIRTDTYSGKHDYKDTCFVESKKHLKRNLNNLVIDSVMKDLTFKAIVVRDFIELDWKFKAFWGELPIAPEVRVMVKDGEVERWFFYWPEDAIRKPSKENWRELLAEMRKIAEKEQDQFLGIAERVAKKFDGYWSVDFARTKRGVWILIDMALGEVSWRPEVKV